MSKAAREHDIVIIGAGAGGGAVAYALTKRGMRVLLLEAGPRFDPSTDYKLSEETWEQRVHPEKPGSTGRHTYAEMQKLDPALEELCSWNAVLGRTNKTERRLPHKYHHVRGVGGSTLAFTGESHRLHPEAMRMQSRFGVAADWPIDYAELEPYYCEAERIVGVAGPEKAGARWRSEPYPLPAHSFSHASGKLVEGAASLGMNWVANSRAALSRPYDGRPNCNYCANCNRGCPLTDKGSVDVTFVRKAEATGLCEIRTGVSVLRIEAGKDDRVRGVHVVDAEGVSNFLATPHLVVSCGAVETPRLLLASDGLANESGQVGKNFMETLFLNVAGLHPENLGSFRGLPSDAICWDFNAPDSIEGIVGGCRFYASINESGLNGPVAYAQRVVGGWGREHRKRMAETFGHAVGVGGIGESLPNPQSFVDLDPVSKDSNGVSLARIHSHLPESEIDRLRFLAKTGRDILRATGATEQVEQYGSYDYFSATHVFGTCRMGSNPEASVVDSHCRSHRWKNLQVVDGSVFPSSGGGESPSLTIQALALRAAQSV